MGCEEIENHLVMLANESRVAEPTHNQALSALLYATGMRLNLPVRPLLCFQVDVSSGSETDIRCRSLVVILRPKAVIGSIEKRTLKVKGGGCL